MIESTKIWETRHRGSEIRFWKTDDRWFAVAPGQKCDVAGHATLRAALHAAQEFINSDTSGLKPHIHSLQRPCRPFQDCQLRADRSDAAFVIEKAVQGNLAKERTLSEATPQ